MENHAKTWKKTWKTMEKHGKTWKHTWKIHEHIKKNKKQHITNHTKNNDKQHKNDPSGLGKAVDPKKL